MSDDEAVIAMVDELCSNMLFADYLLGWLEIVKGQGETHPPSAPMKAW